MIQSQKQHQIKDFFGLAQVCIKIFYLIFDKNSDYVCSIHLMDFLSDQVN